MGAGAVGCYYGAALARAGHEVTLAGRQKFVDAVQTEGLVLESGGSITRVRVRATTDPTTLSRSDLILFCVKAADTEAAGRQLVAHVGADCPVLSLQNGVDNAERLAAVLDRAVVPVAVYVAVDMAGPAHVRHWGRGDLVMGRFAGCEAVVQTFEAAGIEVTVSDQVLPALWQKLITNCAYNALSAITQLPYGRLIQVPDVPQVMADVARECVAVGRGLGIALPEVDMEPILQIATSMAHQYSSTAQDLVRHKPTEINYLNGYIVRQGVLLGIPTPANRVLLTLVHALEQGPGPAAPIQSGGL